MRQPPRLNPEEAGALPAHRPIVLERFPDLRPLTRAERVVIVATESKGFRFRVLRKLKPEGYHPLVIEPPSLFEREPAFDANRTAFFFLEASSDKEFLYQLIRHLYQQWSQQCQGLIFAFWPPGFNDADIFRMMGLDIETWPTQKYRIENVSKRSSQRDDETVTELMHIMTLHP